MAVASAVQNPVSCKSFVVVVVVVVVPGETGASHFHELYILRSQYHLLMLTRFLCITELVCWSCYTS